MWVTGYIATQAIYGWLIDLLDAPTAYIELWRTPDDAALLLWLGIARKSTAATRYTCYYNYLIR